MLQCPVQELGGLILQELADNPALELIETEPLEALVELPEEQAGPGLPLLSRPYSDVEDLMTRLPAPVSLRDHLRQQLHAVARTPDELRVGSRMIGRSRRGDFEGQIGEVASC